SHCECQVLYAGVTEFSFFFYSNYANSREFCQPLSPAWKEYEMYVSSLNSCPNFTHHTQTHTPTHVCTHTHTFFRWHVASSPFSGCVTSWGL
ncbi:unnamed protein product, partial [Gulo gulo]